MSDIDIIFSVLFFILGAIIGSFLNVVIHRVPRKESTLPKSHCPECKTPIKPYDNVPILSWLLLKGKCRYCKKQIPIRYPFVEILTALLFTISFWKIGFNLFLPVALLFIAATIALIFIDAEHMLLPNVITYPMLFFALVSRITFALIFEKSFFSDLNHFPSTLMKDYPIWLASLTSAIFGAFVGGGFLWVVGKIWEILRKMEAMGLGDVKMMAAVGALLGWQLTLLAIFIGAFTGALVGIFVAQKHGTLQAKIPFGVFLGFGSIVSLLFGEEIIKIYLKLAMP
ncbi:MAG: prepilin peptidase [Pyrinomonadaceae bacterium]|nr:prepilin peptidase [Pyrinomonadaceae bacterium]MCX7639727.1 prepilin peptidase [Pyrinomonadaceae bacterium]MDW8304310.1 prepilin peptidase [Acidobacteriota bacterium]